VKGGGVCEELKKTRKWGTNEGDVLTVTIESFTLGGGIVDVLH